MDSPGNKGFRKLSSDMPLIKKQRAPAVMSSTAGEKPSVEHIDTLSNYVDKNLKNVHKPRGGEHR